MDTRQKAVESLKEICRLIGCSGLDPDMCQNNPHKCSIVRKVIFPPDKNRPDLNKAVGDDNG